MQINKKYNRKETEHDHYYNFNLGGNPVGDVEYDGFIKAKLVHGTFGSIIIPDVILIENGDKWIQPLSFIACQLGKFNEDDIRCFIFIDISCENTISVLFESSGHIRNYKDGSELFKCKIKSIDNLSDYASGDSFIDENNLVYIHLYHHTTEDNKKKISESSYLYGSSWNIQGTKQFEDMSYVYFTNLDKIIMQNDLAVIGMSSDGFLLLRIDGFDAEIIMTDQIEKYSEYILRLPVYRESTNNRVSNLECWIDASVLSPQHIYMHESPKFIFYQICTPYIHRVAIKPNEVLKILDKTKIKMLGNKIEIADHVIIGDARTKKGLAAPYNEEDRDSMAKIEFVGPDSNMLKFWFDQGNTDLYSDKNTNIPRLRD